ncbi:multivesicular body subunit 12A [Orussus abietinus]|uniref:multivesicular body subunit 12A n=1 Tax=Orussus abietinus TaxID=222816 RepID=UPI000626781D|nr:multivesicular body subunit 12A [Orussus abietinus]XP_012286828.1 multivesicular body subunit 12A [Orussus abietinus]XP_012286910.1 multivesicular body subunit 12A [Orussus abietinus]
MSQRSNNKMLNQLSSLLPDDRPITAISVVEDIDKCPPNFTVVSRTYDQDSDADLWRESGLFIKKKGRYICLSKTEGVPQCVVEDIAIINERDTPPHGFSMILRTVDSLQRAWRKKQMCYKVRNKSLCSKAVTDIIICSRIKKAPAGFTYAGEINGVIVCYKTENITSGDSTSQPYANINIFQNASPNPSNGVPQRVPPERPPKPKFSPKPPNGIYPQINVAGGKSKTEELTDSDYEVLSPSARIKPTRPAPRPPTLTPASSVPIYGTLPGSSDLDGVPFVLNSALNAHRNFLNGTIPVIKVRTQKELDKEYFYEFRAEKET